MSESFNTYESEFQFAIQEAQTKISQINSVDAEQRKNYLKSIEGANEEAREVLDQMTIEVSNLPSNQRSSYNAKIRNYRTELDNLTVTYNKLLDAQDKVELFGSNRYTDGGVGGDTSEQRKQLLSNNSSLERSSQRLHDSQRIAMETENIGSNILNDLRSQREQINGARNTLSQADNYVDRSVQTLKTMGRRLTANKFISYGIIAVLILLIFLVLFSKFS
ncbi:vesicle transport V-snare protein, putative [Candida dubliniensis CD36]|uniref:Vesicle transport V-snare protein, putative n=1 Tax=Candida dubliniensis (strain CD36 / ATCC MYA-646 / CBS 7987 / NCPF 3949 / NRRL Y-17841) TaxID=573826 RepID=B9WDU7_CANDC|nr:vesicle transport V-snare protein, putative [Candida dubliniensis CD36]CAX42854.1 vesicle transport V-snare protein, putative [Candida dubliniensis CD36]